ncbi:hypothetical protein ANCCAN_16355 [Ancylostoma caninum]|uniref:Neurotransmitter-gated ion-channel ligand-binding domain-containing protein n=1 Tax=Ancylostoma caninum TaxID=29170 RepID=A0A368FZW4_ANCCA|nr:hypothetical protein ANCCAN_16355 [Ancylostoma caninum]
MYLKIPFSANEDFDSTFKSNEVVYNTGEVNWVPPGILRASCKMDITYFPFDEQLCHLKVLGEIEVGETGKVACGCDPEEVTVEYE